MYFDLRLCIVCRPLLIYRIRTGSIGVSSSVYTGTDSPIMVNGIMCAGEEDSVSKCNQTDAVCIKGRAGLICQGKFRATMMEILTTFSYVHYLL